MDMQVSQITLMKSRRMTLKMIKVTKTTTIQKSEGPVHHVMALMHTIKQKLTLMIRRMMTTMKVIMKTMMTIAMKIKKKLMMRTNILKKRKKLCVILLGMIVVQ